MSKESAGALLKAQREQLEMDLEAVCRRTYIRQSYLEAIERGEYRAIGDPVYVRGFIRNYAGAVGLDGDALVRLFNEEMDAGSSVAVASGRNDETEEKAARVPSAVRTGKRGRRSGRRPFTLLEWSILLIAAALVAAFWIWLLYL